MQTEPIASATPDGDVSINILLTNEAIEEAEIAEIVHWDVLVARVSRSGIYRTTSSAVGANDRISSRQAVIREIGELSRRNSRGGGDKSRSHELHKSRLRLKRRGR